jgi:hypothetical protein
MISVVGKYAGDDDSVIFRMSDGRLVHVNNDTVGYVCIADNSIFVPCSPQPAVGGSKEEIALIFHATHDGATFLFPKKDEPSCVSAPEPYDELSYLGRLAQLEELVGKKITSISTSEGAYLVVITCEDGSAYTMMHRQDCCENVWLEDTDADPQLLVGETATDAYCTTSGYEQALEYGMWTFYTIASRNTSVTFRFCGESNGYYSVGVDLIKTK